MLKKDQEKLKEVESSKTLKETTEEIADKLELIRAIAELRGFSLTDVIAEANKKIKKVVSKKEYQSKKQKKIER